MKNIDQDKSADINYQNILEKLRLELDRYKKNLHVDGKEVYFKSYEEDIHFDVLGEVKADYLDDYAESHVEHYLYNVAKDKIEAMDIYLDFLEKIIAMRKYNYVKKWLLKYRDLMYHDWNKH